MSKAEDDASTPAHATPHDGWFDRHQMHVLKSSLLALFVLMVLGGVYISHEIRVATQRANDNATAVAELSKSLDTSRKQLTDHGITPSAPPAKTIVEGIPGAEGAPGANGAPGKSGAQGESGPSGPPGPTGAPGATGKTGSTGQDGSSGVAGPIGPTGAPGINGIDGAQGPVGPAGQDGANGKDGTDGKNGTDGTDGKNGVPPAGWTYTDPTGASYTCSPVSDFDPAAPHYVCTADPVAPTTPPAALKSDFVASSPIIPSPKRDVPPVVSVGYAIISERKRL